MVRTKQPKGSIDMILAGTAVLLVLIGLAMLTSASTVLSQERFGYPYYYLFRQLSFGLLLGSVVALVAQRLPHTWWRNLALPLMLTTLLLLVLVFVPGIGFGAGGASRWIALGSITFQPGELAKFGLIVYLAAWLSTRKQVQETVKEGLIPFLALVGIFGSLLVLQPDISTLGILALSATLMYFVSGAKLSYIATIFLSGFLILAFLIRVAPYRLNRITAFLHPDVDPQGISYQINQSLLAIGSGGLFGRGLGFSRQKFFYLPEPIGDSIFAILAEEIGFIGGVILIGLFLVLAWRGFRIALRAPESFGKLLAVGLTSWIILQAFLNIAGISGLLPLTGVPLPFISYGSSSLVITLLSVGVLLSISRVSANQGIKDRVRR